MRTNMLDSRLLFTRDSIVLSPSVLASAALPLPLVPLKSGHNTLILWIHRNGQETPRIVERGPATGT